MGKTLDRKYTGKNGEYVIGVPARDLTGDEYAALDADAKRDCDASPLYEKASQKKGDPLEEDQPKRSEQADTLDTGQTDADITATGVDPNEDIPITPPGTVTDVAVIGEPEQTVAIQSDHQ